MSKASEELEVKRRKGAFAELKKHWWWFDKASTQDCAKTPVAWQWELLRRSSAYRDFCEKARSILAHHRIDGKKSGALVRPLVDPAACLLELRPLAFSNCQLGVTDPRRKWPDMFLVGCDSNLSWTALTESSQRRLEFDAPLYPRADLARSFGYQPEIQILTVRRLADGTEQLNSGTDGRLKDADTWGKHPTARILPKGKNFGAYVVVWFDVRSGESVANQIADEKRRPALDELIQRLITHLNNTLNLPCVTAHKSHACVIPSAAFNIAQAWIPADSITNSEDILMRFKSLTGCRRRGKWLAVCKKAWAMPEKIVIGGRVVSCPYPEFEEFPTDLKTKTAQPSGDRCFQVGLCAYDCRRIETRFSHSGFLVPFLKQQPDFMGELTGKRLDDALKRVNRLIEQIDSSYSSPSLAS